MLGLSLGSQTDLKVLASFLFDIAAGSFGLTSPQYLDLRVYSTVDCA